MNVNCLNIRLTNCYLLLTDKAAVVIDPGYKREKILEFLKVNEDKERLILITHGHFDHIGGAEYLRDETGVKIGIGALDAPMLLDEEINCGAHFRAKIPPFNADFEYNDGDVITVGDINLKVIFSPGHTKGGVCYLCKDYLFTGDTLFKESIGRDDFPGGCFSDLENSIKKLYTLPESTKVYPGHGESSTIGHEKNNNPYVRG